ncbi:hypothetical protein KBZ10_19410 [Streptomyces sp. F63]|uniref:hypothetical protein n=1 Tax=Streptomyces sp. F63 TaxID=2824887 RepID=UPI001B377E94|nr:hypothetical protein [Streptomyces sp. F63]MBQ0986639.1 hypothetical protein [Streptomyces sp. F63]
MRHVIAPTPAGHRDGSRSPRTGAAHPVRGRPGPRPLPRTVPEAPVNAALRPGAGPPDRAALSAEVTD